MLKWTTPLPPERFFAAVGVIPALLSDADERPARKQMAENYIGGWWPCEGFELDSVMRLCFEGDPPLEPVAATQLREELIIIYPYAWILIMQRDGTFEVARCD